MIMAYAFYSALHRGSTQPIGSTDSQHYKPLRHFTESGRYLASQFGNKDNSELVNYPVFGPSDIQAKPDAYASLPVSYTPGPKIQMLEEHYMSDGTVMWTNAKDFIATHTEERTPYLGISFGIIHEGEHIEAEAYGRQHDEAAFNRIALVQLNRQIAPIASYHDPYF
jgi:hypothetical protein